MASREDLARALVSCLKDITQQLERAYSLAMEEKEALVSHDAEAITVACTSQETVLRRLYEADQRAAAIAAHLTGTDSDEPDDISNEASRTNVNGSAVASQAGTMARAAGPDYAEAVQQELAVISGLANKVREANETNQKLLSNGLEVIASCLRIAASEDEPNTYSDNASGSPPGTPGSKHRQPPGSHLGGSILGLDSKV